MDLTLLEKMANLGLGAVVLVIVLLWKRADDQRREREQAALLAQLTEREKHLMQLVAENRAALTGLQQTVEQLLTVDRLADRFTHRSEHGTRGPP
jgi:hypothetical protein